MAAVIDWFKPKGRHHSITEAAPGTAVAISPSKQISAQASSTASHPAG